MRDLPPPPAPHKVDDALHEAHVLQLRLELRGGEEVEHAVGALAGSRGLVVGACEAAR